MAPTRELAQQIHIEAEKFGTCLGIRAAVEPFTLTLTPNPNPNPKSTPTPTPNPTLALTCPGIRAAVVYGGAPKGPQIGALARGKPSIVVATPGRINDILKLDAPPVTNLQSCEYLVLDPNPNPHPRRLGLEQPQPQP